MNYTVFTFSDIDECLIGNDVCNNADCVNQVGSFTCECLDGFFRINVSDSQSACSKLLVRFHVKWFYYILFIHVSL